MPEIGEEEGHLPTLGQGIVGRRVGEHAGHLGRKVPPQALVPELLGCRASHQQRAERNAGPQSLAEEDERRQRQAGWRPDRGRKPAHGGDHQPEPPRDYVPRREEGDGGCIAGSRRGHDRRNLIFVVLLRKYFSLRRAAG